MRLKSKTCPAGRRPPARGETDTDSRTGALSQASSHLPTDSNSTKVRSRAPVAVTILGHWTGSSRVEAKTAGVFQHRGQRLSSLRGISAQKKTKNKKKQIQKATPGLRKLWRQQRGSFAGSRHPPASHSSLRPTPSHPLRGRSTAPHCDSWKRRGTCGVSRR